MKSSYEIKDCINKEVNVILSEGNILNGELVFFNYNNKVIHIRNYTLMTKDKIIKQGGDFWIVNGNNWQSIDIKDIK